MVIKLKDREALPDLQLSEPAVQLAQDAGVVAGDKKHLKSLQIQNLIQCLMDISLGATRILKDPSRRI